MRLKLTILLKRIDYNFLQGPFGNMVNLLFIPPVFYVVLRTHLFQHGLFGRLADSQDQKNVRLSGNIARLFRLRFFLISSASIITPVAREPFRVRHLLRYPGKHLVEFGLHLH